MTDHAPAPRWLPALTAYRCAECDVILVEVRRGIGWARSLSFRHPPRRRSEPSLEAGPDEQYPILPQHYPRAVEGGMGALVCGSDGEAWPCADALPPGMTVASMTAAREGHPPLDALRRERDG